MRLRHGCAVHMHYTHCDTNECLKDMLHVAADPFYTNVPVSAVTLT